MLHHIPHYVHTGLVCLAVIAGILLLFAVLDLLFVCWDALLQSRNAPREDMMTCDKHGLFPKKYALSVPMDDGGPPYLQCPMCFEDAMRVASERVKRRAAG